jgi:Flp pilus assembly protein CpaB
LSNRIKSLLVILAGVVLLGIGIYVSILLYQRFNIPTPRSLTQGEVVKIQVVTVTRDLFLGDKLTDSDVQLVEVPVELAPRGTVTQLADAVGKILKTDLISGEMVLTHNLADPTNSNHDLSFILSDDHVMMAFPATDLMSQNKVIQRGDIVDIFATFKVKINTAPDGANATTLPGATDLISRTFTVDTFQKVGITALVLEVTNQQNSQVSLDNGREQVKPKIESYLLALAPQDALILKNLKDSNAQFDIVLRSPTSTVQFDLTPVTEEFIVEFYGLEILP